MANVPGPQPDIKFCPVCKASLRNVPRSEMKSRGYKKKTARYRSTRTPMIAPAAGIGSRLIRIDNLDQNQRLVKMSKDEGHLTTLQNKIYLT